MNVTDLSNSSFVKISCRTEERSLWNLDSNKYFSYSETQMITTDSAMTSTSLSTCVEYD